LIELGHRSNQFKGLNTDDVREGEYIGTDQWPDHGIQLESRSRRKKKLTIVGYIAYFKLTDSKSLCLWRSRKWKDHESGQEFQR
jgi:recombinational DNA repair protein RecT